MQYNFNLSKRIMKYQDLVWSVLQVNGYKKTKSRKVIIDIISKSNTVFSFVDIVKKSKSYKLNDITVYRFLQDLTKFNLVKKVLSLHGYIKSELSTNNCLLVCRYCHNISEKFLYQEDFFDRFGIYPDNSFMEIV